MARRRRVPRIFYQLLPPSNSKFIYARNSLGQCLEERIRRKGLGPRGDRCTPLLKSPEKCRFSRVFHVIFGSF